ncbi:ATP-binding protein [candidate division KSB1 bacterium]|nr:ATP-binding protein [candidate division KSB1 bacterium]
MEDLSLHILDVVENSIDAGARKVEIKIYEDLKKDLLEIEIIDDGKGMDEGTLEKALDPFFTTKTVRKVGLGLSLFREAARMANGDLSIRSEAGRGTTIRATFQHSHIDRKPMGDLEETLFTLIIGNPEVVFSFAYLKNGKMFNMNTTGLKKKLPGNYFSSSEGIKVLRNELNKLDGF